MYTRILFRAGLCFLFSVAMSFVTAGSSGAATDARCVGKANGYSWPTVSKQTTNTNICTTSYTNYCIKGQVITVKVVSTCKKIPPTPVVSNKPVYGIGGPTILRGTDTPGGPGRYVKAFQIMNDRGLKLFRVNVTLTADSITQPGNSKDFMPTMLAYAKTYGITLQPVLFATYLHWTDDATVPWTGTADRTALYNEAYARTKAYVQVYGTDIRDWEMGNEVNLRTRNDDPTINAPPKSYLAASFDTGRMNDWVAVLKGQSDAIKDLQNQGMNVRRVLNVTGLDFGFLKFMQSKGVDFDVISYHYYEKKGTDMNSFWNGSGPKVNLFQLLAEFGKPIVINETNCSEIYNTLYENRDGGNLTKDCMESFNNILTMIDNQTIANIEGVLAHTFVDIPYKDASDTTTDQTGYFTSDTPIYETRFGMMYDLNHPKLSMAILAWHAGGKLTADERAELVRIGIIK